MGNTTPYFHTPFVEYGIIEERKWFFFNSEERDYGRADTGDRVNATYVFEKGTSRSSKHEYEEEIARRWWALPLNVNLPLSNGESCQLLYAGRPGGSPGPDIRDAILSFTNYRSGTGYAGANSQQAKNAVGDVEIHIRAFSHRAVLLGALRT